MKQLLKDWALAGALVAAVAAGLALAAPAGAQTTGAPASGAQPSAAVPTPPASGPTWGRHEHPAHDLARMGTEAQMQALLRSQPQARDARAPLGATPLHYAALNEDPGPMKALLAAGADPNARDSEGRSPLHMAAFATRTGHVKLLLRAGGDPRLETTAGRDVLSLARKVRADEVAGEISLWILKGCSKEKPC